MAQRAHFATLEVVNSAGAALINHFANNYSNLSDHHRRYLKVERKEQQTSSLYIDLDDSDQGHDESEPLNNVNFEGRWNLNYYTMENNDLLLVLGKGSSTRGQGRGVDILLDGPAEATNGIAESHALLRINRQSGFLMIEGIDDRYPVKYTLNNVDVSLGGKDCHSLWQTTNRFKLGNIEFQLTYAKRTLNELRISRLLRNNVFKRKNISPPDGRFPVLPPLEGHQHLHNNCLLFSIFAAGPDWTVHAAIDIKTGNPCVVRSVQINHVLLRDQIFKLASSLISFPKEPGLLQASRVSCDHGNRFHFGQPGGLKAAFSTCEGDDKFYYVEPFACGGNFLNVPLDPTNLGDIVKRFRGPMEGLDALHRNGFVHCNVTCRNMYVFSDGRCVLGGLGDVVKELLANGNRTIPKHTDAPEVDGTSLYGQSADVWSFAFAIMTLLFSDLESWATFNENGPQSKAWVMEAEKKLMLLGRHSYHFIKLEEILVWMLDYDSFNRPAIGQVLQLWNGLWNGLEPTDAGTAGNSVDNGRPAKFQKTSNNTRNARPGPS